MIYFVGIVILVFLFVLTLLSKKQKPLIKTQKRFFRANVCYKLLCSRCASFNFIDFYLVKQYDLTFLKKCDYIITKVKVNIPRAQSFIDKQKLIKNNLMKNKPIYVTHSINNKKEILFSMKFCEFVWVIITQEKQVLQQKYELEKNNNIIVLEKNKLSKEKKDLLFLLNINFGIKNKILLKNHNQFLFNDTPIGDFDLNMPENMLYSKNIIDGAEIIVNKFNYFGEYYKINIKNLEDKNKIIKFNFSKQIKQNLSNYYIIKNNKNIVRIYNVFGELFFVVNKPKDMLFDFSQIENINNCNLPQINLRQQICLQKNQEISFEISISLDNQNFYDKHLKFCNFLNKLFVYRVECNNKTFQLYFNTILPNDIVRHFASNGVCEEQGGSRYNNFECLLEAYKTKKISAYEMYTQMLSNLIGLKENENAYTIFPKLKFGLTLYKFDKKLFEVRVEGKEKYIEIDKVKYYNFFCIPKTKILSDNDILLVI